MGFSSGASRKEPTCQFTFDPWVGKIPWRRKWQPTPVFLPGKSHGQRSLAGYSPCGCKESNMIKWLSTCICITDSLCCPSETSILQISYTPIEIFKNWSLKLQSLEKRKPMEIAFQSTDSPQFMTGLHPIKPMVSWKYQKSKCFY